MNSTTGPTTLTKNPCTLQFCDRALFWDGENSRDPVEMVNRDLQPLGIKRSRLEPPGT